MSAEAEHTGPDSSSADPSTTGLDQRQLIALTELAQGTSVVRTARLAGVNRATLFRWLRTPAFRARLNQWRADVTENSRNQLYAMTRHAIRTLGQAIMNGNLQAAMTLLKSLEMLAPAAPGSHDAEAIAREDDFAQRQATLHMESVEDRIAELEKRLRLARFSKSQMGKPLIKLGRGSDNEEEPKAAGALGNHPSIPDNRTR